VLTALDRVARSATGLDIRAKLIIPQLTVIPGHAGFSGFSPTYLAAFLLAMLAVPILIYVAGKPRARDRRAPVWDGGIMRFKSRMQYTATTDANPVRVTFEPLYRPDIRLERASDDPAGRSGPVHYHFSVTPIFERYLYRPVVRFVIALANFVRPIQNGDVNLYVFYVFVVVLIAYAAYTS
jgi:hypothetical protein